MGEEVKKNHGMGGCTSHAPHYKKPWYVGFFNDYSIFIDLLEKALS